MTDRFISPCELPEGYVRELLVILIEECAEVQQRATKALRFGLDEIQPGQPHSNAYRMSVEIGDLQTVIQKLGEAGVLWGGGVAAGKASKEKQLAKYMQCEKPT